MAGQFPQLPERIRETLDTYLPGFYPWIVDITRFIQKGFTTAGDATFSTVGKGPITITPDGTKKYRLGVDNAGTPIATLVP